LIQKVTKKSRKTDPEQFRKQKILLPGFPPEQSLQLKIKAGRSRCVLCDDHACAVFRLPSLKQKDAVTRAE
jgi:hypothetical protein